MKTHTNSEIEEKFRSIWNDSEFKSIYINCANNNYILVNLESKENPLPMKLSYLMESAEFFETKNIDEEHYMASGGCESCGYGSYYDYTFKIKPDEV